MSMEWSVKYIAFRNNYEVSLYAPLFFQRFTGPYPRFNAKRRAFFLMDTDKMWRTAIKEAFPSAEFNDCWFYLSDADYVVIKMNAVHD